MGDTTKTSKWPLFGSITIILLFLDIISKRMVETTLAGHLPIKVIGRYVQLMLVYNKGALFGLDPRHFLPWFPLNAFFFVFSIICVAVIIVYYKNLSRTQFAMRWGLMLILPGALGNLCDRILHARLGVVDFIRVGISERVYWPVFNFADAYVTIGVLILFYSFIREERQKQ
jgi:signal peptidase II